MADDFEEHSTRALQNPEKHMSNPVNAFLAVKRFTSDWDYIMQTYIRNNITEGKLILFQWCPVFYWLYILCERNNFPFLTLVTVYECCKEEFSMANKTKM